MSSVGTVPPYLFTQEGTFDAPFDFEVPASLEVQPYTAHAVFDGTGASGAFRPCLTFYSASGVVLGRYFPAEIMQAGDVAEVTYTPPFGTAPVSPSSTVTMAFASYSASGTFNSGTVTNHFDPVWDGTAGQTDLFDLSGGGDPIARETGLYYINYSTFAFHSGVSTATLLMAIDLNNSVGGGSNFNNAEFLMDGAAPNSLGQGQISAWWPLQAGNTWDHLFRTNSATDLDVSAAWYAIRLTF